MRRYTYILENKIPYAVSYIPDPLCWTEVPDNVKIFKKQRSRWMRGTIETLSFHKKMFLNPKYKLLLMLIVLYPFLSANFQNNVPVESGILHK